uniref:Uncharacterized protein n=1 Tax=Zea mays TaxID=4577 RepID=C4J769_MAIZE|nr:unknown [Zea mays]
MGFHNCPSQKVVSCRLHYNESRVPSLHHQT